MTRPTQVAGLIVICAGTMVAGFRCAPAKPTEKKTDMAGYEVKKTDAEWRNQLTPEQYDVTRRKGTERAFTGKYWNTKTDGTYRCVGCGQALYSSRGKYDSGSGWPSYWEPVDEEAVTTHVDRSQGMVRTELVCSRCGAHLGHLFDDGPRPTGQRHCINSAALSLAESASTSEKNPPSETESEK